MKSEIYTQVDPGTVDMSIHGSGSGVLGWLVDPSGWLIFLILIVIGVAIFKTLVHSMLDGDGAGVD